MFWELLKMEIRNVSITFAKEKKKKYEQTLRELEANLNLLEREFDLNPSDELQRDLSQLKSEYETFHMEKTRGAIENRF
jgi:hypothetical protein